MPQFWEIFITAQDPESTGLLAMEQGATGTEVLPDGVRCYFEGTFAEANALANELHTYSGGRTPSVTEVKVENWVQRSEAMWETLDVNGLTLRPVRTVADALSAHDRADTSLYIIPGLGFGTGHHATTFMASHLTQRALRESPCATILDLGCGSGILGLVAWKTAPQARVVAVDNDPLAMRNAYENGLANRVDSRFLLACAELSALSGQFDLILANLYASLLIGLAPALRKALAPKGKLIVSGFGPHEADSVMKSYLALEGHPELCCVERMDRENWTAALLGPRSIE